jgi:hypothetical protein
MSTRAKTSTVAPRSSRRADTGTRAARVSAPVFHEEEIPFPVYKIGQARHDLSKIVAEVGGDRGQSVIVGNRGKPEMMCVSYQRFNPLLKRGNRSEKFALLIVEELLANAPQYIRAPAVAELSQLPSSDLEKLWGIPSFPLSKSSTGRIKRGMSHPEALDRLAERARIAQVLEDAQGAGLYDALGHVTSHALG